MGEKPDGEIPGIMKTYSAAGISSSITCLRQAEKGERRDGDREKIITM